MEFVVITAIVAVSFGAAATWLLATRLPEGWLERSASEGRYAHLGIDETQLDEADPRRMQARTDTRRVRRAPARRHLQHATQMMHALRHRKATRLPADCTLIDRNEKTRA